MSHDPDRQPPAERVDQIRAAATRMRPANHLAERRTSRRALLLGGVAASAAGVVAGYAGRDFTADDSVVAGPRTEAIEMTGLASTVSADAKLVNHTWGTELLLDVRGLPEGKNYEVTYRDTSNETIAAGSFVGVADILMVCRFNAALLRKDLRSIEVSDEDGARVMGVVLA